jgi:hypothetical protein
MSPKLQTGDRLKSALIYPPAHSGERAILVMRCRVKSSMRYSCQSLPPSGTLEGNSTGLITGIHVA